MLKRPSRILSIHLRFILLAHRRSLLPPLYSAVIPLLVGMSLWLGSFAGAIVAIVPTVLIGIRAMLEEKFLRRELPGYAEYITRARFRMIPYVW
jgi:protein-S-isoprenylcysteine O-methyltransferase Ste14